MSTVDPRSALSKPAPAPVENTSRTRAVASTADTNRDGGVPVAMHTPLSPSRRMAAKLAASLRRRWLSAAMFGLVGGWLAGAVILAQFPAQHRAEVWLEIRGTARDQPNDSDREASLIHGQELLLKSPLVLNAALHRPELESLLQQRPQQQPLDWLDRHINVDAVPGRPIVRVIATSEWADEPPVLAEAVAQARMGELEDQLGAHLAQLKATYQQTQDALRLQREALAAAVDPRLAKIDNDRQQLQRERKVVQAELEALLDKGETLAVPTVAEIAPVIDADAVIRECQKEIDRLNEQIQTYERISARGKNDPAVPRLAAQRTVWQDKLTERREGLTKTLQQQVAVKAHEEFQTRRQTLETKLAGFDESDRILAAARNALAAKDDRTETQTLRDEITAKQETSRRLAAELHRLEAEAKTGPAVTQLGETRRLPDANRNQRLLMAGCGAGATFVMLALFIGWLESSDKRVKSAAEIGLALNVPILGTLPSLRTAPAASDTASGPEVEAVDVLRTLLLRRVGGGPCVILVTSAGSGEGKTTLAGHLAASLARAWRKTLLIDGDLRNPAAHKLFNAAPDSGLSDVLRGDVEAADLIQPTALSRLWLLPAGHVDSHALQALAQPEGVAFLDGLREQYEFIVVDSAPVLAIADTLLLCQRADAVVLAVRCGISRLPAVKATHQRLAAIGAPFAGAVVLGGQGDLSGLVVRYP